MCNVYMKLDTKILEFEKYVKTKKIKNWKNQAQTLTLTPHKFYTVKTEIGGSL
jgi:hypothetical protein